ncbi:hypothetical protein BD311DRAFT_743791 [Dichomitus squalens]|uniref:Uncharacterized protein n=1 Tax=Dichomitus squalens TaxID=114155 RepID=A0A4Q9M2V2_9APHY|nr:hypothetical protein BD311DRAFT_743791 [Dichomitus squalens]
MHSRTENHSLPLAHGVVAKCRPESTHLVATTVPVQAAAEEDTGVLFPHTIAHLNDAPVPYASNAVMCQDVEVTGNIPIGADKLPMLLSIPGPVIIGLGCIMQGESAMNVPETLKNDRATKAARAKALELDWALPALVEQLSSIAVKRSAKRRRIAGTQRQSTGSLSPPELCCRPSDGTLCLRMEVKGMSLSETPVKQARAQPVSEMFRQPRPQVIRENSEDVCRQDAGGKNSDIWQIFGGGGVPSSSHSYMHPKYLGFTSKICEGHPFNRLKYLETPL